MKYFWGFIAGFVVGFAATSQYWQTVLRPRGTDAEGALFVIGTVGVICGIIVVLTLALFDQMRHRGRQQSR